nr:LuxR C-terminal-related transcriptional regulator [Variovorax sp. dw_308]
MSAVTREAPVSPEAPADGVALLADSRRTGPQPGWRESGTRLVLGGRRRGPVHRADETTSDRDTVVAIDALTLDAASEIEHLRFRVAERLLLEAIRISDERFGTDAAPSACATALTARMYYELGDVSQADSLLRNRIDHLVGHGTTDTAIATYLTASRIAVARHQISLCTLLLREAIEAGAQRDWHRLVATCLGEMVRVLLSTNHLDEAVEWACRLERLAPDPATPANVDHAMDRLRQVARSRIDLATERVPDAIHRLEALLAITSVDDAPFAHVELSLVYVGGLLRIGDVGRATDTLLTSLELGANAGLVRVFLDAEQSVRNFVHELPATEHCADANRLHRLRPFLRSLGISGADNSTGCAVRSLPRTETLSPQEIRVLRLMSRGLSNKHVARELGIAPETVKTHAKHFMQKLAAQTRAEAVSRAISLRLL